MFSGARRRGVRGRDLWTPLLSVSWNVCWTGHGIHCKFLSQCRKERFSALGEFHRNNNDTGYLAVGRFVARSVYSFRAERLSLATHRYADTRVLSPNAQNLPVVLNVLQSDHERFERFSALVRQVFPSIRRVSVRPRSVNSEIIVWNADAPAERDDLAIELLAEPWADSGSSTGGA